jgi:hypothetical protein
LTARILDAARSERIVVLDDSLSMQANLGTESAFDRARRRLVELCAALAAEPGDNSLTLLLTSRPRQPVLEAAPLTEASLGEITRTIEGLEPSDGSSQFSDAARQLVGDVTRERSDVNRQVYVLTDLRQVSWPAAAVTALTRLAEKVQGCSVVDCAEKEDQNLSILEMRPDGLPIAGVPLGIDVMVKNQGSAPVSNIQVLLTLGQSLPLRARLDRLGPQETSSVRFSLVLAGHSSSPDGLIPPVKVIAGVETAGRGADDLLSADSARFYAARVVPGVRALLVTGGPSGDSPESDSYFLNRALAPAGPVPAGILVENIGEDELESVALDKYQIVFLLNTAGLGTAPGENVARLEAWTKRGGGLILMPGDSTDRQLFNARLYRDGHGLSPLRLHEVRGDESRRAWVHLQMEDTSHELLRGFGGVNNPLLAGLKIFRWWDADAGDDRASEGAVLARLTNDAQSPAIAEKSFGQGKVVSFCFPADADWHNWPAEPGYVLFMQDLVRYLVSEEAGGRQLLVGQPIRESIDLAAYEPGATLLGPRGLDVPLEASPRTGLGAEGSTLWELSYPAPFRQGFYELKVERRGGETETRLVAANVDSVEGDLRRVDVAGLDNQLRAQNIKLVAAADVSWGHPSRGNSEVWRHLLVMAVAVLVGEQLLGWYLGQGRP